MIKARRVLAAAAVSTLALAGCAQSATHAAIVDGVIVTESEVQAAAKAAAPLVGGTASELEPNVLQAEIQGHVAATIAAAQKVDLSDATRAPIIAASPVLSSLASTQGGATLARRLADLQIVSTQVPTDVFSQGCARVGVVVNPRYGAWAKELCAFESASGSLSKPAPTKATPNA